jgi:hypothetical protein
LHSKLATFQQIDEYSNTLKAKALLSEEWDTNSESLRDTLMSTYKMSNQDIDQRFFLRVRILIHFMFNLFLFTAGQLAKTFLQTD